MLKYDSDIVLKALDKARWELQHAKGDVRNAKAMDFLNDCIEGIETWMGNAQPPLESSKKPVKSGFDYRKAFGEELSRLMKKDNLEFANGGLEDNLTEIFDNYLSEFSEDELSEMSPIQVARKWYSETAFNEGDFSDDPDTWIFKYPDEEIESSNRVKSSKSIKSGYGDAVERLSEFTDKEVDYALNAESLAQFKQRMDKIATKKGITFTDDELEFIYKGGGPIDPVEDEEEDKKPRKYKKYNTPTSKEKFEAENHWFDDSPLAAETYSIGHME